MGIKRYQADVSYPVNTLTKFTSNSGLTHWREALRVLGFLNATRNYCIRYAQQIHLNNISSSGFMRGILPNHIDFNCYVDASHASDIDTRRSITGYIFFISGGPISWQSRMQTSVALSFFGINQFNLAKGLKATQVHDSDTPSPFSQRLGGGVGSKSLNIYRNTRGYRGYIRCASSRLMVFSSADID